MKFDPLLLTHLYYLIVLMLHFIDWGININYNLQASQQMTGYKTMYFLTLKK